MWQACETYIYVYQFIGIEGLDSYELKVKEGKLLSNSGLRSKKELHKPFEGSQNLATREMTVLFPHPLLPTKATVFPAGIDNEKP